MTLEAADATSWSNAQRMLKMVGDTESVRMAQAIALIESAEKEKKDADTEYAGAKAEYDLVTFERACRSVLTRTFQRWTCRRGRHRVLQDLPGPGLPVQA